MIFFSFVGLAILLLPGFHASSSVMILFLKKSVGFFREKYGIVKKSLKTEQSLMIPLCLIFASIDLRFAFKSMLLPSISIPELIKVRENPSLKRITETKGEFS